MSDLTPERLREIEARVEHAIDGNISSVEMHIEAERKLAAHLESLVAIKASPWNPDQVITALLDVKTTARAMLEELRAKGEQPQSTPTERLTHDEWSAINKLRGEAIDHAISSGIQTPLFTALQKIADWYLEPFDQQREAALRHTEALAQIEQPQGTPANLPKAADLTGSDPDFTGGMTTDEYVAQMRGRPSTPKQQQQLPGEDPDFQPCQCAHCAAYRAAIQSAKERL